MAFGAFVAVLFNVTLSLPMAVAAGAAMVATALLSLALEGVLLAAAAARAAPAS